VISLGVSDGPVHDANKVCVAFNGIEFKSGSELISVDLADNVNLIEFQGPNVAPLLFDYELPAGDYQWIRLSVSAVLGDNGGATDMDLAGTECAGDKSYLVQKTTGTLHNMYIPSGAETGLKLIGGFTVPDGGSADFTIEFDLMKSVTAPNAFATEGLPNDIIMRPTLRLVNNEAVGTLTGEVSTGLATGASLEIQNCDASVFVFNDGVTPNAISDPPEDADPVATAMVNEQTNDMGEIEYHYSVGQLSPGHYEVAFTCDGTRFVPAEGKPAEIVAGQVTEVNFL
jgi:hypothetical protein